MKTQFFGLAAAALLTGLAQSQTFETIATESFDYPAASDLDQQNGGFGWFQQWFAFGAGIIDVPGIDAVGGAANMNSNNQGGFRQPKTGPWTSTVAPDFNFGSDSGTIWVSFSAQRVSDEQYGGLSLWTSFVGEKLYLGSPFATNEWGFASPGGSSATVAGSNVDNATRLVYRIDYAPGDETASLWLDPATPHPTTTPDATSTVGDHDWNELRIQSGEGASNGWLFDDIVIECQDCTPNDIDADTDMIDTVAGGVQNLTLNGGLENEGKNFWLLGSTAGTTPGIPVNPFGTLNLNFSNYLLFTLNNPNSGLLGNSFGVLDGDGKANSTVTVPAGALTALAGVTVNHAYFVFSIDPGTGVLNIDKLSDAQGLTPN